MKTKNILLWGLLLMAICLGCFAESVQAIDLWAGIGGGGIALGTAIVVNQNEFTRQFSGNQMLTNASTLRYDEIKSWDKKLVEVARRKLRAFNDLRKAGLVLNTSFGTILSNYETQSDMTGAAMSMDGQSKGDNDKLTFDVETVPVPIIHKSFPLNKRNIASAREKGHALDTTYIATAGAVVAERIETMIFQGAPNILVGGKTIYGYTTLPERGTIDMAGTGWHVTSGRDIIGDTERALAEMVTMKKNGPFTMYVAANVWTKLQLDYSTDKGDRTFLERIKAFSQITAVEYSEFLPANEVVLVQMTEECVDMVVGQDIINVEYGETPLATNFLVYGAMAPRLKVDQDNNCGVVHLTPA